MTGLACDCLNNKVWCKGCQAIPCLIFEGTDSFHLVLLEFWVNRKEVQPPCLRDAMERIPAESSLLEVLIQQEECE